MAKLVITGLWLSQVKRFMLYVYYNFYSFQAHMILQINVTIPLLKEKEGLSRDKRKRICLEWSRIESANESIYSSR